MASQGAPSERATGPIAIAKENLSNTVKPSKQPPNVHGEDL